MVSALDLYITGASGVRPVDDICDRTRVRVAHDVVRGAMHDQHWNGDLFPRFPKIEGLQLLIKRRRAAILSIGLVVPEAFPLLMLGEYVSRRHALVEIQVVELAENVHCRVHLGRAFAGTGETHALELQHVLVPGASPGTGGDVTSD